MASPLAVSPAATSYWCFQCNAAVNVLSEQAEVLCPHCRAGFVELLSPISSSVPPPSSEASNRGAFSFNPLVVLRSSDYSAAEDGENSRNYELYYDEGDGLGLRPVPPAVSESLLGSGFELMLDRISQIGFNLWIRSENPPASKNAVDSLPTMEISRSHVDSDTHCAVCTDVFELGSEAKEMPCKHIYHSDCIVPWLKLHNSCPVCRLKLPSDDAGRSEPFGLTLWRLPHGGFAVGRFAGGSYGEMPPDFSELERVLNLNGAASREIEWAQRRRGGRLRRFLGNLGSVFGGNRRARRRSPFEFGFGSVVA